MAIRQSAQGFLPLAGGTLTGGLVVALGTITADQQNISSTATWNNAGVTFTALKLNITDTASNSSSLLIDLQVAGSSMFKVDKAGGLTAGASITSTASLRTVDGRVQQLSGPVIDMRTANTVKVFQSDNTTKAAFEAGTGTFGSLLLTVASATGSAGMRLPPGAAPTSPVNGDIWTTTAGLFVRINGATVGPLS